MEHLRWRLVAAAIALLGAAALILTTPVRLGLDLQGGTQIVLEARDTTDQPVDGDTVARTLEVLRRRVDQLGVSEPLLQRSGARRIIVELPGLSDPEQAVAVIGQTAQLGFHPVLGLETETPTAPSTAPSEVIDGNELVLLDEEGQALRLGQASVSGDAVGTARAVFQSGWHVEVDFRGEGQREWVALTGTAACAALGSPNRRNVGDRPDGLG